jgi:hypothetical protein
MEKSVILCTACRRVLSVGASLPALCTAAIPTHELQGLRPHEVEVHPKIHDDCVEIFIDVPEDLEGQALLDAITTSHGEAFAAVVISDKTEPDAGVPRASP